MSRVLILTPCIDTNSRMMVNTAHIAYAQENDNGTLIVTSGGDRFGVVEKFDAIESAWRYVGDLSKAFEPGR